MKSEIIDVDVMSELLAAFKKRDTGRFPGTHLSQIVGRLAIDVGRYDKDLQPDPVLWLQGFLFEDMMSSAFAQLWGLKQVYTDLDGIEMSLDGFKQCRIKETKCTKMSARHDISDFRYWPWHVRSMGYCKAMQVQEAEYIILHLNGSYEKGGGRFGQPVIVVHRCWWAQHEIDKSWDMVLRKRDEMLEDGDL